MVIPRHYRLYGLCAASELPLAGLLPETDGLPDVLFQRARVEEAVPESYKPLGPFHAAAPGGLWLHVPGVARFQVREGREVLFEPLPGVDEDSLRVFLLGPCMAALLMQRGLLVLRGCAVKIGDACAVVLGEPASGKSMLAAELARRGHAVLCDDLVAFDEEGRVLSGLPFIKLWGDAAGKLGIDAGALRRTRPCLEKFYWPWEGALHDSPLPVKRIYVLRTTGKDSSCLDNINGMTRFACLHEYGYRKSYLEAAGLRLGHLRRCASLAGNAEMKFLYRRKFLSGAEELAELVLSDAGGQV